MYPNIDAEQARWKLKNEDVAKKLGMHPYTYGQKKLHGRFSVKEAQTLCDLFRVSFEYLFKTEPEMKDSGGI